jgi:hypothetical protein
MTIAKSLPLGTEPGLSDCSKDKGGFGLLFQFKKSTTIRLAKQKINCDAGIFG